MGSRQKCSVVIVLVLHSGSWVQASRLLIMVIFNHVTAGRIDTVLGKHLVGS